MSLIPNSVPTLHGHNSGLSKKKRYRVAATEAGMLLHGLVIEVSVFTVDGAMIFHIIRSFNHYIFLGTANTFIPQAILANY